MYKIRQSTDGSGHYRGSVRVSCLLACFLLALQDLHAVRDLRHHQGLFSDFQITKLRYNENDLSQLSTPVNSRKIISSWAS